MSSALDAARSFGGHDRPSGDAAWVAGASELEAQGLDSGSALVDALRYVERSGERLAARYQAVQAEVAWLEHSGAPEQETAGLKRLLDQLAARPTLSRLDDAAATPAASPERSLDLGF